MKTYLMMMMGNKLMMAKKEKKNKESKTKKMEKVKKREKTCYLNNNLFYYPLRLMRTN